MSDYNGVAVLGWTIWHTAQATDFDVHDSLDRSGILMGQWLNVRSGERKMKRMRRNISDLILHFTGSRRTWSKGVDRRYQSHWNGKLFEIHYPVADVVFIDE